MRKLPVLTALSAAALILGIAVASPGSLAWPHQKGGTIQGSTYRVRHTGFNIQGSTYRVPGLIDCGRLPVANFVASSSRCVRVGWVASPCLLFFPVARGVSDALTCACGGACGVHCCVSSGL